MKLLKNTTLKQALLLSLFWFLLSGLTDKLVVFCGAISIILTIITMRQINVRFDIQFNIFFLRYLLVLLQEIALSSIDVIKIILNPNLLSDSKIVNVQLSTQPLTPAESLMQANAITMTPGTVVIAMGDQDAMVHVLNGNTFTGANQKIIKIINDYRLK